MVLPYAMMLMFSNTVSQNWKETGLWLRDVLAVFLEQSRRLFAVESYRRALHEKRAARS